MHKIIEVITTSWNPEELIFIYRRNKFSIKVSDLNAKCRELVQSSLFISCQFQIKGYIINGKIDYASLDLEITSDGYPERLADYKYQETEYVEYVMGRDILQVQRNGFLVYCAPTGQGKTYFALSNLKGLAQQCDTVIYINLELSVNDIYDRLQRMKVDIPKNVYIKPFESIQSLTEWGQHQGKIVAIIDNIDNLVGGGQDPFGEQLEYIKQLDRWLKDNNHHALVLTQLVKDNNIKIFEKDGDISGLLNTNILSGVKQLSYLSRTVVMTAFNEEVREYKYKILKMGSAKLNEL